MEIQMILILLFLLHGLHLCSSMDAVSLDPYKISTFTEMNGTSLNHSTIAGDGSIYVAGVDVLYHVSQDLNMLNWTFTNGSEVPNINKILAIVPEPVNKLITCGSGLNLTCQLRNLDSLGQEGEISYVGPPRDKNLLVTPGTKTTVGLVVTHATPASTGVQVALYVAQSVTLEETGERRPISLKCLAAHDGNCTESEDRKTNQLSSIIPGFIVKYASVFSYNHYTYFLASQPENLNSGDPVIVPKLSRVCQNEASTIMPGFTEVTLQCRGVNKTLYSISQSVQIVNDTLYAVFVKNDPPEGGNLGQFHPTNQSALCLYDMEELIEAFNASTRHCACADGDATHSSYLKEPSCRDGFIDCDKLRLNLPCEIPSVLGGVYPAGLGAISGDLILEQPEESFSSILVTQIHQPREQFISFIGTKQGHLCKVKFDSNNNSGILYEKLELSHPVLSDTWISADNENITVLTEKQLLKLSVANCSQYLTCDECIKPGNDEGDPYCGWCTLEKQCTRYHECKDRNVTNRWLYSDEDVCVQIDTVEPAFLPVDTGQELVDLTIEHLPSPDWEQGFNYSCHFGTFTSFAYFDGNPTLTCDSPSGDGIPRIPGGESDVAVNLSISSSLFNVTFVTTTFHFFDCSKIKGCIDCVTARWGCAWCIDDLVCRYNGPDSRTNITSSAANDTGDACPQLLRTETIDVPAGVEKSITVTAKNLNQSNLYQKEYECVLEDVDGNLFITNATKERNTTTDQFKIICGKSTYRYRDSIQEKNATLTVRWKGYNDTLLDGSVNVILYKCRVDRPDCSRCLSDLTTRPELQCRWCTSSPEPCVYESECSSERKQEECPGPKIISVSPQNGTIGGGTEIRIGGTDLGQSFEDIDNITLAGIECDHRNYRGMYEVGASVVCISNSSSESSKGPAVVTVEGKPSNLDVKFSYNDPNITDFWPKYGPESGGTVININGTDLHTGRKITVMLGDRSCTNVEISDGVISCTNMASTNISSLTVSFDGHIRIADGHFTFLLDPVVDSVQPRRAIMSGGNILEVVGQNFDTVLSPQIVFTLGESSSTEHCSSVSPEKMVCSSPTVNSTQRRKREEGDDGVVLEDIKVGFIMDGVASLLNWSDDEGFKFEIVKDPEYEEFPDGLKEYDTFTSGRIIELKGTHLNLVNQKKDVTVYIGKEKCTDMFLSLTELVCTPPSKSPAAGDVNGNRTDRGPPYVTVEHANRVYEIGYLKYTNIFELILFSAAPVIGVLVLIIFCSLCSVCYTRRQKAAKIHDLELQVMEIQDSVSGNLKSLFATLQTTAEDFDTALGQMRNIPLLSRKQYILNMLFLGFDAHPSDQPTEEVLGNPKIKTAMTKFSADLLSKKDFLEVLIKTLDQSSHIGSMEKVNMASLLSLCLLLDGKQELLTTVMIKLMREQIEDCDAKVQKCRILFSRTETVLEKLVSNWVTIFQYQYLKDHAAMPLHHLFHAIKYVCEMGPVDAVTGKSQFSINDQQMLETQIDFNQLSLSVIVNSVTGEKTPISALDVNTVTQVKQRIISFLYKDTPFSEQPDPYMYDLMWRTGRGGQLVLRDDDDLPGNTENEWRKLNTLGDFNVTSGIACFELVEKQANPNATLDVRQLSAKAQGDTAAATIAKDKRRKYQAVVSRHSSFRAGSLPAGLRPWHLVKELDHEDDDNNKRKEIKEVVLPFLPATRNYIQKYVDPFFGAVFAEQSDISPAVKYLFQIFDREADKLEKPDFAKAWKDNVFTLRYWTTILANPQYALDLGIHSYTSASLRILVQVVKDTCAGRSKPNKTDFSPSRLLYSNAIPGYISKLANFYSHVGDRGKVTSENIARECTIVEQDFEDLFDLVSTQYELYKMLESHRVILSKALGEDDACEEADMAGKLHAVREEISG